MRRCIFFGVMLSSFKTFGESLVVLRVMEPISKPKYFTCCFNLGHVSLLHSSNSIADIKDIWAHAVWLIAIYTDYSFTAFIKSASNP